MLPYEVMEIVNTELNSTKFMGECTMAYLATIRAFVLDHVVLRQAEVRKSRGMFEALERHEEWDEHTDLSLGASGELITSFGSCRVPIDLSRR